MPSCQVLPSEVKLWQEGGRDALLGLEGQGFGENTREGGM